MKLFRKAFLVLKFYVFRFPSSTEHWRFYLDCVFVILFAAHFASGFLADTIICWRFRNHCHFRDFPGSPVVRTLCFPCRGPGFDPWSGELRPCKPHDRTKKENTASLKNCPNLPCSDSLTSAPTHTSSQRTLVKRQIPGSYPPKNLT